MRSVLIGVLVLFSTFGCTSETENKGIKNVADFYGCLVTYSIGKSSSIKGSTKTYFELKLNGSKYLNSIEAELIASNAAYLFYSNLIEDEKQSYSFIRCNVEQTLNGSKKTTEIDTQISDLQIAENKIKILKEFSSHLQLENYHIIYDNFSSEGKKSMNKNEFTTFLKELKSTNGGVKKVQSMGFSFFESDEESKVEKLIGFTGIVEAEKKNFIARIILSIDPTDNKYYGMEFK